MHSYNFDPLLRSIETIRIVQNSCFGVFSTMESYPFKVPRKYGVPQWDLNQEDEIKCDTSAAFVLKNVLRLANFDSVVAMPGKYFLILFHVAISIAEGLVE